MCDHVNMFEITWGEAFESKSSWLPQILAVALSLIRYEKLLG